MSTPQDLPKPDFAAAATTLRETVKWLAAAFAALAAVVVGTGPISSLGKLPPGDERTLAWVLLLFGFVCICAALWITLRILRPEAIYRSYLIDPAQSGVRATAAEQERLRLRKTLDKHAKDVLPHNLPTLDKLAEELRKVEAGIEAACKIEDKDDRERQLAVGRGKRGKLLAEASRLLPLAMYLRLQQRLQRTLLPLFMLGVAALLTLAAFGAVTHYPDDSKSSESVVVNNFLSPQEPSPPRPPLPELEPVLFETGQATIDARGLKAIQRARDELAKWPQAALLIRAHTDTVASHGVNEALARRRSVAVQKLLLGSGGVSAQRVYIAMLPEQALPSVTRNQTANEDNRSVRMQLVLVSVPVKREN